MADFYKGRGEMSRGALGIIAVGISPILAAEAAVAGRWFYSNVAESVALRQAGFQSLEGGFSSNGNYLVRDAVGRFASHPKHMKPLADAFNYAYGLNPAGMATATTPINHTALTGIPAAVKWGAAGAGAAAIIFSEVYKLIESRKSSTK